MRVGQLVPIVAVSADEAAGRSFTYVNPGNFSLLLRFSPARSWWSRSFVPPNAPILVGVSVALQAYFAPTGAPIGLDFTNGVHARIGP